MSDTENGTGSNAQTWWAPSLHRARGPAMSDVEALADWFDREPLDLRGDDDFIRLAHRFLASDWLATHDAEVRAKERERIARAIEAEADWPSDPADNAYKYASIARGEKP